MQLRDDAGQSQQQNPAHHETGVRNAPSADRFLGLAMNNGAPEWCAAEQTYKKDHAAVQDKLLRVPHARAPLQSNYYWLTCWLSI